MDTEPTLLYLATILPPILLLIIIWKADRFKEPGHLLAASFLLGAAIGLPLDLLIGFVQDILAPLLGLDLQNLKDAGAPQNVIDAEYNKQMKLFKASKKS